MFLKINKVSGEAVEVERSDVYDDLIEHLNNSDFAHDEYDSQLDSEGAVVAGGYEFWPSRILKELDPIAYDLGYDHYAQSEVEGFINDLELNLVDKLTTDWYNYTYKEDK